MNFNQIFILLSFIIFVIALGYVLLRKFCQNARYKTAIKLTSLPPELLVIIFSRLPLKDLLRHISPTCYQFALLIKDVCGRRGTLTLVYGNISILVEPFFIRGSGLPANTSFLVPKCTRASHTLHFRDIQQCLTRENAERIVNLFPNVRSLQLSTNGLSASMLEVANVELLQKWNTNLESLQLMLYFELSLENQSITTKDDPVAIKKAIQQTIPIINQASKLRRLALTVWAKLDAPLELPILSQLYEFYFYSADFTDTVISNSLESYGLTNDSLTHVGLWSRDNSGQWLVKTILSNQLTDRMFASKLTHLNLNSLTFPHEDNVALERFFVGLPNLVSLFMAWYVQRPLVQLIRALGPISGDVNSKLSFLALSIVSGRETIPEGPHTDPSHVDLSSLITNDQSVCQLRSIKLLNIYFLSTSHESVLRLQLNKIFPNLSFLDLALTCIECPTCSYNEVDYRVESWNYHTKVQQCIKLMVQPLELMSSKPKIMFKYASFLTSVYYRM